ncbi:MAG: HAD family hydrolase, partial [Acutalibacteraceae bacterium]
DFPIKSFYEFCGFDFSKESYDDLCDEYTAEYTKALKYAGLFGDAVPVFEKLKNAGIKLVIISATKESVLKKQVASFGIESYFESIIGTKNLHGSSKIETALSWFSANKISAEEAVFIGDTTHDSETAEAIGCECFLVCRGHNSKKRLSDTGRKVFSTLEEAANKILK